MIDPMQYIRQHLQQRAINIKLQNFLFLPFSVGKLYYEINGYHQSLFIELAKLPVGTVIIAENNAIEITERHKDTQAWEEFTGQITVELKEEQTGGIEFIQIIR